VRISKALFLVLVLAMLAVVYLIEWNSLLLYLISVFPTSSPAADALALVVLVLFILAFSLAVGSGIGAVILADRYLMHAFSSGFSVTSFTPRSRVAYLVASLMLTPFFVVLAYVLPSTPYVQYLPSVGGFSLSSISLLGLAATPGQPFAGYVQVGLFVSGPAAMFLFRLSSMISHTPGERKHASRIFAYLVWVTLALLVVYFINGGGTIPVQNVPTAVVFLVADFFSLVAFSLVFIPLEVLIRKVTSQNHR